MVSFNKGEIMKSFNEWVKEKILNEFMRNKILHSDKIGRSGWYEPEEEDPHQGLEWPPTIDSKIPRDEIMKKHVIDLNLDVRNRFTLMNMGINTIGELMNNLDKVLSHPHIDREELETALKSFRLI